MNNYTPIKIMESAIRRSANANNIKVNDKKVKALAEKYVGAWNFKGESKEDNVSSVAFNVLKKENLLKKGA